MARKRVTLGVMIHTIAFLAVTKSNGEGIEVSVLGRHLDRLMNKTLGVEKIQERINVLNFKREQYNGAILVKELSEEISGKIGEHIDGLRKTKRILHDEILSRQHKKSSNSIWPSCCRYEEDKTAFHAGFKTKIDTEGLCELVSDSTAFEYYHLPAAVLEQMRQNHRDMPSLKWQYVGSNQGVFSSYPAHRSPELCTGTRYDPRYRPWYVEAASPEEKNVVILLDSSNSMAHTHNSKRLIDVAIDAVEILLDSFTPNDKVGIVSFNDTAFYPNDCFSKQLGYADTLNKKKLKDHFLANLRPGGQSNYAEAFRAAFNLFTGSMRSNTMHDARPTLKKKSHCVILFISDGDASEIHHGRVEDVYRAIREGNRNILNSVKIFTYGLGREANLTLLDKIARQDFDYVIGKDNITTVRGRTVRNVTQGRVYRIHEPAQLRNDLSFFYTNLLRNDSREDSEPSFSVPYVDTGGLGLIFTAGFPVFGHGQEGDFLAAVVAIDISIADLLGDVIKLKNDDRSYVFVIDGSGRVLIHPLLPVPDDTNGTPSIIHIEALERDASVKHVLRSMIEGKRGRKTILSSRVAPAGDCNQVFIVNQTYHWHPIANTNFSLCFVEEETDYIVSLPPGLSIYGCTDEDDLPMVAHQCPNMTVASFKYHRLDLTDSSDVCRHFYQMSTVKSSVVKLAPQCFVDHGSYEHTSETAESVEEFERILNTILRATSPEEVKNFLRTHAAEHPGCAMPREDVISDIVWTACADFLWLRKAEKYVVRRYIGTRTGMMRFYPGTNISASYDPITRDWYELALAYPGKRVFSPPYKDAAGAGNVITISHTVHTPRIALTGETEGTNEQKIIGVMGLDLSLTSFYAKLVDLYPQCDESWHCFIVDIRGYFVLHSAYTEAEKPERKHIVGDEGPLSQILLHRGLMYRARCLELETTKYKVSYVIVEGVHLDEMANRDKCKRYFMEPIPNSNVFFVAREFHSTCYYETCLINNELCHEHHECVNHDDWSNVTCECPCRADLVINSCDSFVDAQVDIVACYPFRDRGIVVKNDCLPKYLTPCYDPQCDQMSSHFNCSSVVGCIWCRKTASGSTLEKPYCAATELCYDGFDGHRLPGFVTEQQVCEVSSENMDEKIFLIAAISGGLAVLIIVLAICACRSKRNVGDEKEKSLEYEATKGSRNMSEMNHEVATIAAAIGAREQLARRPANSSYSNSSSGRCEARRSSASSLSSTRQKSMSTPQVVLSIVDSDGEEIARSLPRPVQIVRGGQGTTNIEGRVMLEKDERQIRGNSTTSIVIGSAGENSTSGEENRPDVQASAAQQRPGNNGANSSSSTEDSVEMSRNRHHSQSAATAVKDIDISDARNEEGGTLKVESRSQSNPLANVLRSVLKKKVAPKDVGLSRSSSPTQEHTQVTSECVEPCASYCDMFAEPTSNEGDIPIIQSDHSDSESTNVARGGDCASDYVSVCSESGRISSGSWVASTAQRGEPWQPVNGTMDNHTYSDTNEKSDEVFYDDEAHGGIVDDEVTESDGRLSISNSQEVNNSRLFDSSPVRESVLQTSTPQCRKRLRSKDRTERLKTMNTDNFIVYV